MRVRLGLRWGSSGRVFWLGSYFAPKGSSNDRFKNEIWNLKHLNRKPSDGWACRRGGAFSQQGLIFIAEGYFRSPFHSCEMGGGAAKWHSCAKWWFRSCEMGLGLRNGAWAAKLRFLKLGWFHRGFRSCEIGVWGCKMALVCQGVISQLRKFWQRVAMGLRNHFAAEGHFRIQPLISQRAPCGYKIISQQMANFVGASLGLWNLADLWIFLAPELLFAPWDLPSLVLQFLLN